MNVASHAAMYRNTTLMPDVALACRISVELVSNMHKVAS